MGPEKTPSCLVGIDGRRKSTGFIPQRASAQTTAQASHNQQIGFVGSLLLVVPSWQEKFNRTYTTNSKQSDQASTQPYRLTLWGPAIVGSIIPLMARESQHDLYHKQQAE